MKVQAECYCVIVFLNHEVVWTFQNISAKYRLSPHLVSLPLPSPFPSPLPSPPFRLPLLSLSESCLSFQLCWSKYYCQHGMLKLDSALQGPPSAHPAGHGNPNFNRSRNRALPLLTTSNQTTLLDSTRLG